MNEYVIDGIAIIQGERVRISYQVQADNTERALFIVNDALCVKGATGVHLVASDKRCLRYGMQVQIVE